MVTRIIDTHPHVISEDETKYPPTPLFGIRSDWSQDRHVNVEQLIAAMDQAGVAKAAVVHSSTTYGFNNSYVLESCARYAGRLMAVCSVDVLEPGAPQLIRDLVKQGLGGLRVFTGGSTKEFDPSELEDPRSYPVWQTLGELGLAMCIQTGQVGLPQVAALAKQFPDVPILLDHLARPDVSDGAPYEKSQKLFELGALKSVHLKITPRIMDESKKGKATPETFFPKLVEIFGADRLVWGSNFPTWPGPLTENVQTALSTLSMLSEADREWIFAKTAQKLYPALRD